MESNDGEERQVLETDIFISSDEEEYSDGHEFLVKRILAEKVEDGQKLYLLCWADYPEEESTWEPPENIQDPAIINSWEECKVRQSKGIESAYNVKQFDIRVKKHFAAKNAAKRKRRQLRRERRKLMGIKLSDDTSDAIEDDETYDDAESSAYSSEPSAAVAPSSKRQSPVASVSSDNIKSKRQHLIQKKRKEKMQQRVTSDSESSSDEPIITQKKVVASSATRPTSTAARSASKATSSGGKAPEERPQPRPRINTTSAGLETASKSQGFRIKGIASPNTRGARGAVRGNVFSGGRTRQARRPLIESAADTSQKPKHFGNMHLNRKVQLAGRSLADKAPDISALPGGLINPSKSTYVEPVRPETLRKHPSAMQQHEGVRPTPPIKRYDQRQARQEPSSGAPNAQVSGKDWQDIPWERRTICFFFHKYGRCEYVHCKLVHDHNPQMTVADPPPAWEDNRATCSFYNTPVGCNKGVNCLFRHEKRENDNGNLATSSNITTENIPICYFWYCNGNCSKRDVCRFVHLIDSNREVALPPGGNARSACALEMRRTCPNSRQTCPLIHPHASHDKAIEAHIAKTFPLAAPVASMAPEITNTASTLTTTHKNYNLPKSGHRTAVCRFWIYGNCRKGSECLFLHEDETRKPIKSLSNETLYIQDKRPTSNSLDNTANASLLEQVVADDDTTMVDMDTEFQPQHKHVDYLPQPSVSNQPQPTKHLNMEECPEKGAFTARSKMAIFGAGADCRPIKIDIGVVPLDNVWARACANTEVLRFDEMCTATDFGLKFQSPQHVWNGVISAATTDSNSDDFLAVDRVAEHLRVGSIGLLCECAEFVILVYPFAGESWNYLETPPAVPDKTKLRYLVYYFDKLIASTTLAPVSDQTPTPGLAVSDGRPSLSHKSSLAKTLYNLSYDSLLNRRKARNADNFFLIYPASATQVANFLACWLRSCQKDCKIYSCQTPGSWDFFVHRSGYEAGAIIVYETAVSALCDLPWTRDLIDDRKSFLVWCASDSTSRAQLEFSNTIPDLGSMTLTPLFPLGAAVFITPSFLAAEPAEAYKFLKWYLSKIETSGASSYKLVCCHDFRSYLVDLAIQKSQDREDFLAKNSDLPAQEYVAKNKGLSYEDCDLRFATHQLFADLLDKDIISSMSSLTLDPAEGLLCPVEYAHPSIDCNDEKSLVSWFAGWTMANLDTYRRFYVLGSSSKNATRAVITVPSRAATVVDSKPADSVPPNVETGNKEKCNDKPHPATAKNTTATTAPQVSFALPGKNKALAIAAKYAKASTTSTPVDRGRMGDNGKTKSPKSLSVDTSITSGITTAAADADSDDSRDRDQREVDAQLQATTTGQKQSAADMESPKALSPQESVNGRKECQFEPTEVWYPRWRQTGRGWEHILIGNWERVFGKMGIA